MPKSGVSKPLIERFLPKVGITDGCWEWQGVKDPCGYGRLTIGSRTDGTRQPAACAHRVAYEMWVGEVPDDSHVLHKCDNPACVRPDHLWLGSNADNIRDRDQKRRHWAHRGKYLVTFQAMSLCVSEWAKRIGIGQVTLWCRINVSRWSIEDALTRPLHRKKPICSLP
jgi:HNH endonuclease